MAQFEADEPLDFYEGTVKSVDEANGFGFIRCPDLLAQFGSDVYALLDQLSGLGVGDQVSCSVRRNRKSQLNAVRVLPVQQLAEQRAYEQIGTSQKEQEAVLHQGSIKSFDESAGFGFIFCPEIQELYGCDVFLHHSQLSGFRVGDVVRFVVRLNARGKPQAHALSSAAGRDEEELNVEGPPNEEHLGVVKCFYESKGFGFIASQSAYELYGCDVFVHWREFEGFSIGDKIRFTVMLNSRGKPQAANLCESQQSETGSHDGATSERSENGRAVGSTSKLPGAERQEGDASGGGEESYRYEGTIKHIDTNKGFGFIRCVEAYELYGCDVYVNRKNLNGFARGDKVTFALSISKKGTPQGLDLSHGGQSEVRSNSGQDGDDDDTLVHKGFVKLIDLDKGFGFIRCPEVYELYGSDIFLADKQLKGLTVGTAVSFSVRVNKRGQPQAVDVTQDAEDESTWVGTIKSFDPSKGYGFISCAEAFERYERDVFVHSQQMKDFRPGDSVTFISRPNGQGHPQAYSLQEAPKTALLPGSATADAEGEFQGKLKSFSEMQGYGFIGCPSLHAQYGRDVFAHSSQLEGIRIGDSVSFSIQVKRGQPQACGVEKIRAVSGAAAGSTAKANGTNGQEVKLEKKLLRACASARVESVADMQTLLAARADSNARDVTGQTPLVISSLNSRNSERKCRLLLEHRADLDAMYSSTHTVLQWMRERLNRNFADYLEAVQRGDQVHWEVAVDADPDDP
mmetsp:Transcript_44417/g.96547  ORF Transcript_44417/g.96547 Transcript_44417/m.96547 type:complete len:740 (+) Transcript_44417:198-2417(+)